MDADVLKVLINDLGGDTTTLSSSAICMYMPRIVAVDWFMDSNGPTSRLAGAKINRPIAEARYVSWHGTSEVLTALIGVLGLSLERNFLWEDHRRSPLLDTTLSGRTWARRK